MTVSLQNTNLRIPEYVKETYPLFNQFILYYYQWLGLSGNPGDLTVDTYRSISECPDAFLGSLSNEFLPDFPGLTPSTLRMILTRHLDFYTSKGSEDSIKFLFRVFYQDETVEFFYPQEWILNVSDTTYAAPMILMCQSSDARMSTIESAVVYGQTSGSSARVENVSSVLIGGVTHWILTLSDVLGDFKTDTNITLTKGLISFSVKLDKLFGDIEILDSGYGYAEGDTITLANVDFVITETTEGYIDSLQVIRRGEGYMPGDLISLADDSDAYSKTTIFAVETVDVNGGILTTNIVRRGGPYKQVPPPIFSRVSEQGSAGVGAVIQPIAPRIGKVKKIELKLQAPQTSSQPYLWGRKYSTVSNAQIFANNWEGSVLLYPFARTNYIRQSDRAFYDPFFWTPTSLVAYTDSSIQTPWGASPCRVQFNNSNGGAVLHRIQQDLNSLLPFPASDTFTTTIILHPDQANQFQFTLLNTVTNAAVIQANLNTIAKTVTGVVSVTASTVTTLANGWIRFTITGTPTTTGAMHRVLVDAVVNPTSFVSTMASDGTHGYWMGLMQFEMSAFPTSYISSESYAATVVDYTLTDTGILSFWADNVTQNKTNYALQSDTFGSSSGWTTHGTATLGLNATLSPDGLMNGHLIANLGNLASGNYIENKSIMLSNVENSPSFYLKKNCDSGKIAFYNADNSTLGYWLIDFALLTKNWERIHADHPAVLEYTKFVTTPNGTPTYRFIEPFIGTGGLPVMSFYINGYQLELGETHQVYIPTTNLPSFVDVLVQPDIEMKREKLRQMEPFYSYNRNRQLWSNRFADSNYWLTNSGSVVVTPDVAQAPDGSITASIVDSANWTPNQDSARWLAQYDLNRFAVGKRVTLSCWIKLIPGTDAVPAVQFWQYPGQSDPLLVTETWTRFTWTTTVATSTYYGLKFGWPVDGSANNNRFALWGFQLEEGEVATPYIDSTGQEPVVPDYGFVVNITTTGVTKKLYEHRINRHVYSENLSLWGSSTFWPWPTLTAGQVDPLGGTTAYKITQSAAAGISRYFAQSDSTRFAPGTQITMSCWIKLVPGVNAIPPVNLWAHTNSMSPALNVTSTWQRFTWTTHVATSNFYGLAFGFDPNGAANDNGFVVWGFQVEEGAEATDYIKTTNLQVTVNDYYINAYGAVIINNQALVQPSSVVTWTGTHEKLNVEVMSPTQPHPLAVSGYQLLGSRGTRKVPKFSTITWTGKITKWDGGVVYPVNEAVETHTLRDSGAYTLIPMQMQKAIGNGGLKFKPNLVNLGSLVHGYRNQKGLVSGGSKMADDEYFHHLHYCIRSETNANTTEKMLSIPGLGVVGIATLGQFAVNNAKEVIMKLAHPAGMKMSWERHGEQNICGESLAGRAIVGNPHSVPADMWTDEVYNFESGIDIEPPQSNYSVV